MVITSEDLCTQCRWQNLGIVKFWPLTSLYETHLKPFSNRIMFKKKKAFSEKKWFRVEKWIYLHQMSSLNIFYCSETKQTDETQV